MVSLYIERPITANISLRGGIRWTQRGYALVLESTTRHNEYQTDKIYKYTEDFSFSTIEIPVGASYLINDKIAVNINLSAGLPLKRSAKRSFSIAERQIINGEETENDQIQQERKVPESTQGLFLGLSAGIDYQVFTSTSASFGIQRTINHARLDGYKLSDNAVMLSFKYILPFKF